MYDVTNEDFRFWTAEADEAFSFEMLSMKMEHQYCRRQDERSQPLDYTVIEDLFKAAAVFRAQYFRALMYREVAAHHLSLVDICD